MDVCCIPEKSSGPPFADICPSTNVTEAWTSVLHCSSVLKDPCRDVTSHLLLLRLTLSENQLKQGKGIGLVSLYKVRSAVLQALVLC